MSVPDWIAAYSVASLPHALGGPLGSGVLRGLPEDFQVDEILGFASDGEGEHVLLHIEKRNTNTEWLARQLARFAGVPPRDVGFAGLKDRRALTRQWLSVRLAGAAEPDWAALESDDIRVLSAVRHRRKLRRGALRGNRFRLRVRELQADPAALQERLGRLGRSGAPGYFGEQRFGKGNSNLLAAEALLAGGRDPGRQRRSLALSAARSFLFNEVLAERIREGTWDRALPGDLLQPDGSHGVFSVDTLDPETEVRVARLEVHPTGPLWGIERIRPLGRPRDLERGVAERHPGWVAGLGRLKVEGDRRALRMVARDLQWEISACGWLDLSFSLGAGGYATVVLRELLSLQTPD